MEELLQEKSFEVSIDERIAFDQLNGSADAVWSLLVATGYLKVVDFRYVGDRKRKVYTLSLTNLEVVIMFENMVRGWFGGSAEIYYNHFIKALLMNDVDGMNEFMNKVALHSFSSFDTAKNASDDDVPERFYHGFVLELMVELSKGLRLLPTGKEVNTSFARMGAMISCSHRETGKRTVRISLSSRCINRQKKTILRRLLQMPISRLTKNSMMPGLLQMALHQVRFENMDLHLRGRNV